MKVWIVCVGEPLPEKEKKTRLRRMGNLAIALANDEENQVEWLSSSFDHYQKKQLVKSTSKVEIKSNYHIHMIYSDGYDKNISYDRIKFHNDTAKKMRIYMNEIEKPDIVISSMEPLEIAECATIFGKENNIPVVIDVRDLWPEIYYEIFPKYMHLFLMPYVIFNKIKLKKIMRNAYSIFGLSQSFLNYGLKYAGRKREWFDDVIPIAYPNYDYEEATKSFDTHWKKWELSKNDFIIVFLGNFGNQFEFTEIIEASKKIYKKNSKIKFVLCGTGKNAEFVKMNVNENVIMPGWIYQDAIMSLLAVSKIGIAPYIDSQNYRNNTPNKFGEYLSASLPILVSVSGDMENLLSINECGYRYRSSEELYDEILKYYNSYDILKRHSSNARKLYENMFESSKVYDKMISKLDKIAKKNKEAR